MSYPALWLVRQVSPCEEGFLLTSYSQEIGRKDWLSLPSLFCPNSPIRKIAPPFLLKSKKGDGEGQIVLVELSPQQRKHQGWGGSSPKVQCAMVYITSPCGTLAYFQSFHYITNYFAWRRLSSPTHTDRDAQCLGWLVLDLSFKFKFSRSQSSKSHIYIYVQGNAGHSG